MLAVGCPACGSRRLGQDARDVTSPPSKAQSLRPSAAGRPAPAAEQAAASGPRRWSRRLRLLVARISAAVSAAHRAGIPF
jgi:hypothetical protein